MEKYPNLIRLESIGDTHEGRPIMMVTVSQDVAYANLKPALLYTGTIHAREWIGIELAVNFIQYLLDNYPINPDVVEALTRNSLYMVPCLNLMALSIHASISLFGVRIDVIMVMVHLGWI